MARRMSRKLVDVKTLEELAVIQEALNRRKVRCARSDHG